MIDVAQITDMQHNMVDRWHNQDIDNPYEALLAIACQQHAFNFQLWHEEDVARSGNVGDERIAKVKRAIDGFNQQRNDWIEKIDDQITAMLEEASIEPAADARLNTETPGSAMDRLSIMSLRIYHMEEQTVRDNVTPEHLESVRNKLALCLEQHSDLSNSLQELLADIFAGKKQHKTYRQMKMYNDPSLNPFLYEAEKRMAT